MNQRVSGCAHQFPAMGFILRPSWCRTRNIYSVQVRAVDVTHSVWDYALKPPQRAPRPANRLIFGIRPGQPAIRLGLRLVASLSESTVHRTAADSKRRLSTPGPVLRISTGRTSTPWPLLTR
jgi:hypothetical protein